MRIGTSQRGWLRYVAVVLPFATGVSLVIHIVSGFSLVAGALVLTALGVTGGVLYWQHLLPVARADLRHRLGVAVATGIVATVAYDLSRVALCLAMGSSFDPFAAWPVFGQLLTGEPLTSTVAIVVGTLYHACNGIGFGVAYVMVVRRPGVVSGLAWGFGLELAMALLYPSWLRIRALEEFLTISMVGHAVYGLTLGLLARRMLR